MMLTKVNINVSSSNTELPSCHLEGTCWVTFIFLTFYLELGERTPVFNHIPYPQTHTCEETNQTANGLESAQDTGSAQPMKMLWVTKTLLLSFALWRGHLCWLSALQSLLSVPGQHSQSSSGGLRMLRDAIGSTSPFLPRKSTPISLGRASPFCQHRKWGSQPGYLNCALTGYCLETLLTSGWESGKPVPMSSLVLNLLGNHFGTAPSSQIPSLFLFSLLPAMGSKYEILSGY